MIEAILSKDTQGDIRGFSISNHGETRACAAVSMLAINTINSIELFTEDDITYEYDEDGGYLKFALTDYAASESAGVLLKALELGLNHVRELYPEEIIVRGSEKDD